MAAESLTVFFSVSVPWPIHRWSGPISLSLSLSLSLSVWACLCVCVGFEARRTRTLFCLKIVTQLKPLKHTTIPTLFILFSVRGRVPYHHSDVSCEVIPSTRVWSSVKTRKIIRHGCVVDHHKCVNITIFNSLLYVYFGHNIFGFHWQVNWC